MMAGSRVTHNGFPYTVSRMINAHGVTLVELCDADGRTFTVPNDGAVRVAPTPPAWAGTGGGGLATVTVVTKEWCVACRRRVQVDGRHTETVPERRGEHSYTVTELACGHTRTSDAGITGPSTGEPVGLPRAYDLTMDGAR